MSDRFRKLLPAMFAVLCGLGVVTVSHAQSDKPISLVVGYSAGGSADFVARVVGEAMSKRLGRQIIIENVVGASGMLAVQKVLNAPADGNLLYMGGTDTVAVPMVNPKAKVDWERDFAPVGRMTTLPMIFAVPKSSPYSTLGELIAALRKGGKDAFNYATPGVGTMQHFYGSGSNQRVATIGLPHRNGQSVH